MREHRDILALFDSLPADAPAVLATVVDVQGSAYRRPGARLLLTPDGRRAGSISGGCLENDLARRAFLLTEAGPRLLQYDTRGDDILPAGEYNTGCDGVIRVLVERADADTLQPLRAAQTAATSTAVGVVYATAGECDWQVGQRLTDLPELPDIAARHRPMSKRYTFAAGSADVLLEPLHPPRSLIVFGTGDDAKPMVEIAQTLGWHVTVVGKRPGERDRFPHAQRVLTALPEEALRTLPLTPRTAVVLMMHSYDDDRALLPALLASPVYYVALLGPKSRTGRLMKELHTASRLPAPADVLKLHTPAGLDLGGDAPASVALSIAAEIEAVANGRSGGALRDRLDPIHDPHPHAHATPVTGEVPA